VAHSSLDAARRRPENRIRLLNAHALRASTAGLHCGTSPNEFKEEAVARPEQQFSKGVSAVSTFPNASSATVADDRRHQPDRRTLSWQAVAYGSRYPRRWQVRRQDPQGLPLVDLYPPRWLLMVGLVLLLSAIDAIFTVQLLSFGAQELNPVMDGLLALDVRIFAIAKVCLTGLACATLLFIGHFPLFQKLRVSQVFIPILTAYTSLIGYELWLLGSVAN
jgi:hypothetical protein